MHSKALFPWWAASLAFASTSVAAVRNEQRDTHNHYPITGLQTGVDQATGARPARRNILDLQQDEPTWSLYIQALNAMQNTPESDPLSYYQISGIHGRPYTSWDNVGPGVNAPLTGYCTHDSVLFPSWHRPYLVLYEQVLAGHVQTIASTYSSADSKTYKAAADNFRIPYWDWASVPRMPDVVNAPMVTVTTPSGVQNVSNPLLQYRFQNFPLDNKYFPSSSQDAGDWYLASYSRTVRSPDADGSNSDFDHANQVLENNNLKDQVYYALTKSSDYDHFATQAVWGPSIENVHSLVHVSVGGSWGHMSQLSYSGFDPIFWLHHVNIDRITALYQAMYPSSYLTPYPDNYGTYVLPGGGHSNDTLSTPLEPFSTNAQGTFYTTSSVQSLGRFGYSYPEIQDWNQSPKQIQASVTSQVNTLYGPSGKTKRNVLWKPALTKEWSVAVSVSKCDLNQRFIIRFFLGDIPPNPQDWPTSNACVGSFPVLPPVSRSAHPPHGVPSHNEISLTGPLKARGYDGQDAGSTAKYLEEVLQWRVQLINGTVIPTTELKSLRVRVYEETVTLGSSVYNLPTYGDRTEYPEITKGKAGG